MAVDPDVPFNREEMYLAAAAGEGVEVPPCPWSRKEAYLADIGGRLDDMDTRIAALATDISFKGSVATEDDLPSGAAVGDAYITEDTGVIYVWVGDSWVALGGTGINVVQTIGASETDVMSQKATSGMVYADAGTNQYRICIGKFAQANGDNCVAIGSGWNAGNPGAKAGQEAIAIGWTSQAAGRTIAIGNGAKTINSYNYSIAIGDSAQASANGSVALGKNAKATLAGEVNIGSSNTSYGYNSTEYRLLTGVHDPVNAHDAATKNYVDGLVGNIESALHAINNGGSN